jgi:pimeloyl-ACP methyl ester carboxylesterase
MWRINSAWSFAVALSVASATVAASTSDAGGSVSRSDYWSIDGARHFMTVRGADRRAPVLLWLHGGPGGAERPLFRYYDADLETRCVVAYWDQRGAGRSFDPNADPKQLTIARHLADLDGIVDALRTEFGASRVVLLGHSWGGALGLMYARDHADKVAAVIAIAPVVDTVAQQQAQYAFVVAEATRRNDRDVLAKFEAIGAPPYPSADAVLAAEAIADRYGAVYHARPNRMSVMVQGIFRGLVTPWEIPRFIRGNNVTLAAMNDELLGLHLPTAVPSLDVPVFFFLGRYDRHADANVAARYVDALGAPVKRVVWFENSAHNVPFEEPDAFTRSVIEALESIGALQ